MSKKEKFFNFSENNIINKKRSFVGEKLLRTDSQGVGSSHCLPKTAWPPTLPVHHAHAFCSHVEML